ncbi:hypothetical protein [Aeromonas veronii]|uniref:hypothetical protein n=1 Tax=Aeromonas veronii TaxID=654 RepID=UPI002444EDC6|nr:hypothetical protein [Aeromonas veronii]
MLAKVCQLALTNGKEHLINDMYELETDENTNNLNLLQDFYLNNSDDEFINMTVPKLVNKIPVAEHLVNNIVDRKPWKKLYEAKVYYAGLSIVDSVNKEMLKKLNDSMSSVLIEHFGSDNFIIDIMTDNAFKDIDKTEVKLLRKTPNGKYQSYKISDCGDKLNMYQTIRYFIRVFVNPATPSSKIESITNTLDAIKIDLIKSI